MTERDRNALKGVATGVLIFFLIVCQRICAPVAAAEARVLWVQEPCDTAALVGNPGPETCLGKLRALSPERAAAAKIVSIVFEPPRGQGTYGTNTRLMIYYEKEVP